MKNVWKSIIAVVLALSMLMCATVPVFAARTEEYISDLRIIYAKDAYEAEEILEKSEFKDYKLYRHNLNEGSGEIGVYMAYKVTTDIEDAITDLAIMQMGGGYREGNYQAMIQQSRADYKAIGEIYLQAINYMIKAYEAGDFLATAAFRQLNLYVVESEGIPKNEIPAFEGQRLGDIFAAGVTATDLATMFMEGNAYVLQNVRSLLAMGVSYNEDGRHYLKRVEDEAAKATADPGLYADKNYKELASIISGVVLTFRDMFKELATHEPELNYMDNDFTDLEIQYAEYKSIADRLRAVDYLGGQTLYDFCLNYVHNEKDLTSLYPLVAVLNEGQAAMTKASHYYDVVRYSMSDLPVEDMEKSIAELEDTYKEIGFSLYAGVDRSIFYGTYALTNEAYRANAYTESGFAEFLTTGYGILGISGAVAGATFLGMAIWAIHRVSKGSGTATGGVVSTTVVANGAVEAAKKALEEGYMQVANFAAGKTLGEIHSSYQLITFVHGGKAFTGSSACSDVVNAIFKAAYPESTVTDFTTQMVMLQSGGRQGITGTITGPDLKLLDAINRNYAVNNPGAPSISSLKSSLVQAQKASSKTASTGSAGGTGISAVSATVYLVGGLLMLYSAITIGISLYNYYNPDYDDVPIAMVDMKSTVDGDRYVKYDVVYEAEVRGEDGYAPADLNAYEGHRWNALYYTKSYEAGNPLLADTFTLNYKNSTPRTNYAPVHRFGETVCYDINKYNFEEEVSLYMSVKRSKNQKSAAADVPQVVGSVFGAGFWLLAGGIGLVAGIGGTLCTQSILAKGKKKKNASGQEEPTEA